MKKFIVSLAALICVLNLFSQKSFELDLWEQIYEDNPILKVFLPEKPNGVSIIACPGGGYSYLEMEKEGTRFASWFNEQGITFIVLKYRMPKGDYTVPLADAKQAMNVVKNHADEWKLDKSKIGIMGFSAGGHLASTLATRSEDDTRPAFQILFYPVISMKKELTHQGSRDNLLGKKPSKKLEKLYSNEIQVTKQTPKTFIVLSNDDKLVSPLNGVKYYEALHKNGVTAEIHIYSDGGHGWGFNDKFKYTSQWQRDLFLWLKDLLCCLC